MAHILLQRVSRASTISFPQACVMLHLFFWIWRAVSLVSVPFVSFIPVSSPSFCLRNGRGNGGEASIFGGHLDIFLFV